MNAAQHVKAIAARLEPRQAQLALQLAEGLEGAPVALLAGAGDYGVHALDAARSLNIRRPGLAERLCALPDDVLGAFATMADNMAAAA